MQLWILLGVYAALDLIPALLVVASHRAPGSTPSHDPHPAADSPAAAAGGPVAGLTLM